ncbi:helix-turn-helix domain-containing protein [uncultured Rhodospira sp.]|mgnify:CR=1 FL=1|uniref:helix-turn-helix domain-containing protein n=1 Tax=uncultured Rhodospira sp. TaxID=1936189 RepID=UPI00262DA14E|nr:helix-turn-helix domain-containing protein [uncultured Rhodospira sp.]
MQKTNCEAVVADTMLPAIVTMEPIMVSIPAAMQLLGVGKTTVYEFIEAGHLDARKVGTRTLVVVESMRRLTASLPPARVGSAPADSAA